MIQLIVSLAAFPLLALTVLLIERYDPPFLHPGSILLPREPENTGENTTRTGS